MTSSYVGGGKTLPESYIIRWKFQCQRWVTSLLLLAREVREAPKIREATTVSPFDFVPELKDKTRAEGTVFSDFKIWRHRA